MMNLNRMIKLDIISGWDEMIKIDILNRWDEMT
jgi:hypothetical protein